MAVRYRIYSNNAQGGPLDLDAPIGETDGLPLDNEGRLSFVCPPLSPGAQASYLVRPYDSVSGLEDPGLDARVDITLDDQGRDVSAVSPPPLGLSARATAHGTAQARWTYLPIAGRAEPTHFDVWLTPGESVDWGAAPVASVPFADSLSGYEASLSGLADGQLYSVGVRSRNATGTETNTDQVQVVGDATAPLPVEDLTIQPHRGD